MGLQCAALVRVFFGGGRIKSFCPRATAVDRLIVRCSDFESFLQWHLWLILLVGSTCRPTCPLISYTS